MLAAWLARMRLLWLFDRRQAEYVMRMIEMFQRGDYDEALKHAIPLSSMPGPPKPPSLGVPSPRMEVRLAAAPRVEATTSIGFGELLFQDVRSLYRRASERLEREGRIEEAAFVLVDLLDDAAAGVELLERHRRFSLAAQIAEARELPGGLVVRLWFLAGDRQQAIDAARRHRAFADAVRRLEHAGEREQAHVLRLLWADRLASAGDFRGAVNVVWPVDEARHLAEAWIEAGIAGGGAVGGSLLARKLVFDPAAASEIRERLLPTLRDPSSDARRMRESFAESASDELPEAGRPIARAVCRALLADASHEGRGQRTFQRLKDAIDDAAFHADRPRWPSTKVPGDVPHTTIADADRGLVAIRDAVRLPGSRWLVALGEMGVQLRNADGRVLTSFEQPAERLVLSTSGHRALGLCARGSSLRLSRFDLVERRARMWCEARIDSWAPTFDGECWYVVGDGDLLAIDAVDDVWGALWRARNVGPVLELVARDEGLEALLRDPEVGRRVATYEHGARGLVLRSMQSVTIDEDVLQGPHREALAPGGRILALHSTDDRVAVGWQASNRTVSMFLGWEARVPQGLLTDRDRQVAITSGADHTKVWLLDVSAQRTLATVRFDGAAPVGAHMSTAGVALFDGYGRLIGLDALTGALECDLRI
jgi:hypothetical protein